MEVLEKENGARPSWHDFKLSNWPIVVTDSKASKPCAVFWRPSHGWSPLPLIQTFQLPSSTQWYEEIRDPSPVSWDEANKPVRTQLQRLLKEEGFNEGFLWVWGHLEQRDFLDPVALSILANSNLPLLLADDLAVAIHEAFHFLVQLPGKSWVMTSNAIGDEAMAPCYVETEEIKSIHQKEIEALLSAFTSTTKAEVLSHIRRYLQYRSLRYSLMLSVTYEAWAGANKETRTTECASAESGQEHFEGVAQYLGYALMLDLNLATREQIGASIRLTTQYFLDGNLAGGSRPIHSYYYTGALSLLLIRDLYEGDFMALTEKLSQSSLSITDLLTEVVNRSTN